MATSPDVPGLIVEADTVAEAMETARDVAKTIVQLCVEQGDPLPPALAKPIGNVAIDLIVPVTIG